MKRLCLLVTLLTVGMSEAHNAREISDFFNKFEQESHPSFMSITEEQRDRLLDLYRKFSDDLRELVEKISAENGMNEPLQFKTLLKVLAECDANIVSGSNIFHFSLATEDEQNVDSSVNVN